MNQINLFLKPVSLCILVLLFDNVFPDIDYSDESSYFDGYPQKCFQLEKRHGVCEVVQSLYNASMFPNMLGHQSIAEAKEEFLDFQPLIDSNCSKSLEKLLCFIYFPPCTQYNSLLKVCQSYCEDAVTAECRDILIRVKKQPPVLECGNYPRSDNQDNICITPNDTLSKNGGTVSTATSGTVISPVYVDETSQESKEDEIDLNLELLVINGDNIQLLDLESTQDMDAITLFRMQTQLMSTYMDYYGPSKYIFWSSSTEAKILRGTLNIDSLTDIRPIIDTGSASVESIAIDWNLRVLFWTESVPVPRLRTSSLSGRMVTTLLSEGMKKPKCLTTDPLAGKLFWIDRRGLKFDESTINSYSIVSEKYSTVFNITSTSITDGGRATALVADYKEKRLYFVDSRSQSLHSIKYDGSDHKVLLEGKHPLLQDTDSLAIHGKHILWIDTVENNLVRADKKTGENVQIITDFGKVTPQNMKIFKKHSKNSGLSTYDKSSLTEKWHDLSSKENMEDLDFKVDDDFYNFEDYSSKNNKPTPERSASGTITLNLRFMMLVFLVFIDLVL